MQDTLSISLKNLKWVRIRKAWMTAVLLVLSLTVSLDVFYVLRQPGLTLAGDASCGLLDHRHSEECYEQQCICELVYEPHEHTDECYETRHVEAQEIIHVTCGLDQIPHQHSESCFVAMSTAPVTESIQICENADEEHSHDENCFEIHETPGSEETVLNCELVYEPHEHTDECYTVEVIEAYDEEITVCTPEEIEHIHTEACYEQKLICQLEEHAHDVQCYSDVTADVETMLDWQNMFAAYPYSGKLRKDLVGIAKTQVGYSESLLNFEVGEDGIQRGYTRYGAWYGMPYSDWSAMFVSFCLNYAGADPAEVPGNTGSAAMEQQWENLGKYAPAGEYTPISGDLVFFADKKVGIVTEVYTSTFNVIYGDVNDAVCSETLSLIDASITGWGITEIQDEEPIPEFEELTEEIIRQEQTAIPFEFYTEEMLDISNGPALFIFAGGETMPQVQVYSLRAGRSITDLLQYLTDNGGGYFFTLLDKNNHELPKDANGNYIAQADVGYKLTITYTSPNGFHPGIYQYQIPNGLLVDGGEGSFVLKDGTNVGDWAVTDDGLITLNFNEHINSRTEITISSTLGIHFPQQEEPYDFDGKITVTVEKPQEEVHTTKVNKWGSQGNPVTEKNDPSKIYWTILITGNKDSNIPGSVLSDQVLNYDWSYEHRYTESDIAAGISFGVTELVGETGEESFWHTWKVTTDDPGLTWDENGWSYTMPETVHCTICNEDVSLGNENWTYYVEYTSTPVATDIAGGLPYANMAKIDGQTTEGWAKFTQSQVHGAVFKNGSFVTDAGSGKFHWDLQVTIPGRKPDEKASLDWFINDIMTIRNQYGGFVGYAANDLNLATVTANYHGKTINVPRIQDATENDSYAWMIGWSSDQGGNGFYDLRQVYILCRCNCTEDSCGEGTCWTYGYWRDDGTWENYSDYCPCWTETEDTTFTFSYQTEDLSSIRKHFGLGYSLQNEVLLANRKSPEVDKTYASVPIPNVLAKELTHDFDGYTANYKVTVNESKLVLTNGSPLFIHDVMTDSLAYISGSMVITTEDANGNVTTLKQGSDFTVTYNGRDGQLDENGKKVHVLDIVILHPQPVMYTLDYDATLIIPEHVTEGIKYNNSATISLWGQDITDVTDEKVHADINIAANNYMIEMYKTSASTGEALGGATFGLFNEQGGLITSAMTDNNGKLVFQSNIVQGIVLRDHVLYYMQELRAPNGYKLDDTKHWFCFCDKDAESCEHCDQVIADSDAQRIPFEQFGKVEVSNELMKYSLPSTGGCGVYPLMVASMMFIVTPLVYGFILRRKRERRGAG